ncbi:MAG: hypothetical protein M9952_02730 [Microthrixaceae bacterium]|nr:hypothetical protein [Microthrixaceae bacterium]
MIDGTRSWELYLYDHSLRQTLTLSLLERIVPGALDAAYGLDVDQRWFSISLDLYAEDPRPIGDSALHFYVTNTGVPASCTSFGTTPSGLVRENDYTLFDGRTAWAAAANWLDRNGWGSSANVLLWDEARPCSHIALATKPHATGVYFGGLNVKQVLAFAQRSNLTDPAIKDLSRNQADFDHLLLDVAIDAVIREDRLHITKVAYFSS